MSNSIKIGPVDQELWNRACRVIPWATQTQSKVRPAELAEVMPAFIRRAKGCRVWDVDGRRYLDYNCSLGPVILGHQHPDVIKAVRRQLNHGVLFPMASELEIEVAELIQKIVPCAQRVRFLKTGADANSACLRLARAATGRDMVVITGYHGWHDSFLPTQAGVPEAVRALTVRCPFGNIHAVEEAFQKYPGKIAAVLTLPYNWVTEPSKEYLQALRKLTQKEKALLIFDEVFTGFRLALGGGQEYFGVTPDLASYAKAFANGFPLAAFVGSEAVMEEGLRRTRITTTYAGETLSLAAAKATLSVMQSEPVHQHLWTMGRRLMDGLKDIMSAHKVPAVLQGLPPRFSMIFQTGDPKRDASLTQAFTKELFQHGIFQRDNWILSYGHREEDIRKTLEVVGQIIEKLHS